MAFQFHPDRNPGDLAAEEKFRKIVEAYEVLNALEEKPWAPTSKRKPVKKKKSSSKNTQRSSPKVPKKNLRYNVFISLEDILNGTSKIVRYLRTKEGHKENVQLKIDIPAGTRNMQRLKVEGFGDVGKSSAGDLFIVVHHQPHPLFEVQDCDLYTKVPVTYLQALLGSSIEVPTLTGKAQIQLKPCVFHGIHHELPQKGLPLENSNSRGTLYIEAYISHPQSLEPSSKKALEELGNSWPISNKMKQYQEDFLKEESS